MWRSFCKSIPGAGAVALLAVAAACSKEAAIVPTVAPQPSVAPAISVDVLSGQIAALTERVSTLQRKQLMQDLEASTSKKASFDPTNSSGFEKVETNLGTFLVSVENVVPYLDGQRITVKVGNPYAASYSGVTLDVEWGPRFPDMSMPAEQLNKAMEHYNEASHTKKIELTEVLRAGSWNRLTFVVAPAEQKDFGRIEIAMEAKTASLNVRP